MASYRKIHQGVYQIGGSGISGSGDCSVFIIEVGDGQYVMIDSGAGGSEDLLVKNIENTGLESKNIAALILTHGHIDHIGSAKWFKERFGCRIIAHEADVDAIEGRDVHKTAAHLYGVDYEPVKIDEILTEDPKKLRIGEIEFNMLHTPGHTPGSISVYCDIDSKRILFGQDIHGPFDPAFGSDIEKWKASMRKLLLLEADILCEGHFGVYQPGNAVKRYIEGYLERY